jgi:hypothetical protein
MEMETVSETLNNDSKLTRLISRDFIALTWLYEITLNKKMINESLIAVLYIIFT